jgi:hypothetical protein
MKAFDGIGKRLLIGGGIGAVLGLTHGLVNNDYPALATIAGLGVGGTFALPASVGDYFAKEAGLGVTGRVGVSVAATVVGLGGLALIGRSA